MIDVVARAPDGASGAHDVEAGNAFRTALAVFAFAATLAYGTMDVFARPDRSVVGVSDAAPPPPFPTQFSGLRAYFQSAVKELCLVAVADAPSGMGGVLKVDKNGTQYAVYLVEVGDTNASPVRIQTSSGTKAIRNKT
jgi:hypothetical protein